MFLVAREGGLDVLQSLVNYELRTTPLDHQILRTLANLARDGKNNKENSKYQKGILSSSSLMIG